MLSFVNDYSEGCFPEILDKFSQINFEKIAGYGTDKYCAEAESRIKQLCNCPQAQVYFLTGGTQSNQVVIESLIDSFDGVVCAATGHVNVHEAGAIEYTGHKVMPLKGIDGKIIASELEQYVEDYYADSSFDHMVRPAMVYISHPTEIGTLYSKSELEDIRKVCDKYNMPLYLDGARLSSALTAQGTDVTLEDIARLTDVFYIGGTKCGALYGEAVVFTKNNMPFRFNTRVKQHGAMLAKGWLAGVQFSVMLSEKTGEEGSEILYIKGGAHANKMADKIRKALHEKGYRFYIESTTNQIFVIADAEQMKHLSEHVEYSRFDKFDDTHSVIRFVTSWATRESDVDKLIDVL